MMYLKIARHDRMAFVPCSCLSFKFDRNSAFIECVSEGREDLMCGNHVLEGREDSMCGNHVLVDSQGFCHTILDFSARTPEEFFKKCLENDCLFFSGTESSDFKMLCALKSGNNPV